MLLRMVVAIKNWPCTWKTETIDTRDEMRRINMTVEDVRAYEQ